VTLLSSSGRKTWQKEPHREILIWPRGTFLIAEPFASMGAKLDIYASLVWKSWRNAQVGRLSSAYAVVRVNPKGRRVDSQGVFFKSATVDNLYGRAMSAVSPL
jgi:hypothetical protein